MAWNQMGCGICHGYGYGDGDGMTLAAKGGVICVIKQNRKWGTATEMNGVRRKRIQLPGIKATADAAYILQRKAK